MTATSGRLAAAESGLAGDPEVALVWFSPPDCVPYSKYTWMAVLGTTLMVIEVSVGRPRSSGPGKLTCASALDRGNSVATNPATNKSTLDGFISCLPFWNREIQTGERQAPTPHDGAVD